jgi:H+/gluconate symporter-like permease
MPPELQPILAAVLSVVALILLVTRLRVHPFLGLLVASLMETILSVLGLILVLILSSVVH